MGIIGSHAGHGTLVHVKCASTCRFVQVFLCVLLLGTLVCGEPRRSAAKPIREAAEYKVKAAYLYNFLMFVTWQETASKTLSICIIGDDPFRDYFSEVEGKPVKATDRHLVINRMHSGKTISDCIVRCHVLFISASEQERFADMVKKLDHAPVLTVSDAEGFLESGGMIRLLSQGGKLRWEINQTAVKRSGLKVSSLLYQSALRVVNRP